MHFYIAIFFLPLTIIMCIQLRDVPRKMCKWGSQNKYVEQSDLLQNFNVFFQESIEVQMQS